MSVSIEALLKRLSGETLQSEDEDDLSLELQPPATEQAIARAEEKIGRAIPGTFRDFLTLANGAFFFGEEIFGCQVDAPFENGSLVVEGAFLAAGLLPFHAWGNGDYDSLDCNRIENGEPLVVFCNHGPEFTVVVAKSFGEWCQRLFDEIKAEGGPLHPSDYMRATADRSHGIYAHVPNALAGRDCELWATYGSPPAPESQPGSNPGTVRKPWWKLW